VISKELSALVDALARGVAEEAATGDGQEFETARAALLVKLSELERDAQRYGWLEKHECISLDRNTVETWGVVQPFVLFTIATQHVRGESLAAIIDAAREVPRE
jgi:hypothetical protein